MAVYMIQASYTSGAWGRLVQRPEDRMEALKPVIERLGGKLLDWYYSFGEYDVMLLIDVPDNVRAAAASMRVIRRSIASPSLPCKNNSALCTSSA